MEEVVVQEQLNVFLHEEKAQIATNATAATIDIFFINVYLRLNI